MSANEFYQWAADDLAVLTGLQFSKSTQQRLVHRQDFQPTSVDHGIKEMSVDGGKIRLRTPTGEPSAWRDDKGVNLHGGCVDAFFRDNVGGSQQRLDAVEAGLWRGETEESVRRLDDRSHPRIDRFTAYLAKHRHRIVNYSDC